MELFLNANLAKFGLDLKKKIFAIVRYQLIPEYVASNFAPLLGEVRLGPLVADPKQQNKVEGLVSLYDNMEVNDYDWQAFGPAWNGMRWDYFSFDPPETMPWDPGVIRYRKVTYPAGMENWFATGFEAKKAGWQNGLQPFGQENGKQVLESEREFKKREGGHPICYYIDQNRLAEFQSGKVTIAATGFMHIHLRSMNKANFMGLWFEEMKMPPLVVMKQTAK